MTTEVTCPITCCEIQRVGITCYGNVYEYSAIKRWFKENDTDPLTNEYISNKFIIDFGRNKSELQIEEKVKDIQKSSSLRSTKILSYF